MFILKRKPSLTVHVMEELKEFVGKTVEVMLLTKEETIHAITKYDLVLIFSWEREYIEGSIFQLSTFDIAKNGLSSLNNTPLYSGKRHFNKKDDAVVYIDDNDLKGLSERNILAFYNICELIRTFEVEVVSSKRYMCKWI